MIDRREPREMTMPKTNVLPFPLPQKPVAKNAQKALCIPCAVKNHEFKERAPISSRTPLDTVCSARAWIDGRSFELFHYPTAKVICIRCGEKVHAAYAPEEERIA
ncbi:MAG: hypothetical protein A4E57_00805 [Syntrophorhabdaceae bacterium PtaU1.Bin034]|nr:MAG: hypothetical protein A4E57_00805 [Syntrophorhabdaceae bacterium PtaU1.Bin034]